VDRHGGAQPLAQGVAEAAATVFTGRGTVSKEAWQPQLAKGKAATGGAATVAHLR